MRVGKAHAKTSALGFQEKDSMGQDEEHRKEAVGKEEVSSLILWEPCRVVNSPGLPTTFPGMKILDPSMELKTTDQ